MPFHLYNLAKLPLPTHDEHDFYCRLAMENTAIAFARSTDYIIQITEPNNIPPGNVWHTKVKGNSKNLKYQLQHSRQ